MTHMSRSGPAAMPLDVCGSAVLPPDAPMASLFRCSVAKGGLSWEQERPEQLRFTPLGEAPRILERGMDGLSAEADAANRITVGHPEGMVLGFANLYRDIAVTDPCKARRSRLSARRCILTSAKAGTWLKSSVLRLNQAGTTEHGNP